MFSQTIYINIADLIVAIETSSPEMVARLEDRYRLFLTIPQSVHAHITLELLEKGTPFLPQEAGSSWITQLHYEDETLFFTSYFEQGEFDTLTDSAVLRLLPQGNVENFLRAVYAWLCVQHDSLLLHSAGMIRDGQGYLFFGPSGAGKSTTSQLSADIGITVVSDDLIVVRWQAGQYHLCGCPFLGEMSHVVTQANARAPLKGIFRLHQDSQKHQLRPISSTAALAELASSAPFLNHSAKLNQRCLEIAHAIIEHVPLQRLHFQRNAGFWHLIP